MIGATIRVSINYLSRIFIDCGVPSHGNILDKRLPEIGWQASIIEISELRQRQWFVKIWTSVLLPGKESVTTNGGSNTMDQNTEIGQIEDHSEINKPAGERTGFTSIRGCN